MAQRPGRLGHWIRARIQATLDAVDYTIFTPGSDAGMPVNIMGSLAAPALDFDTDAEAIRERIAGTVAALLGLVELKADPVTSREAILLAAIFEHFWRAGEDLDLPKLILAIQSPPVQQVGVFDTDTFFAPDDRFKLAMLFNNLVASPTFQSWLEGEPLDIDTLFFTETGKPRHSIFYIAHLSENQRMFFTSLLLESLVTWMRGQEGTTSLRALLYFDEVFGFFPPSAEPPSKRPLLTLLKQGRAYGLGTVLVTQNPVDIDYKGLTNAGTWFIGKLQAERDKERVLAGLKGALAEAGSKNKTDYGALISQLDSRVFLMHNVHEDRPVVFHTRWVHSYLRGPLTRPQVSRLQTKQDVAPAATPAVVESNISEDAPPAREATPGADAPPGYSATQPGLDPAIQQVFLPVRLEERAALEAIKRRMGDVENPTLDLVYDPVVVGAASVSFVDRKTNIDVTRELLIAVDAPDDRGSVSWADGERLNLPLKTLRSKPETVDSDKGPFFTTVPEGANSAKELTTLRKDLSDWLYYNERLPLQSHPKLALTQRPDESDRDFHVRLQQAAREARDADIDTLKAKFAKKIDAIEAKKTKEARELDEDQLDYSQRQQAEWVNIGESVIGLVVGRRSSRALSSAMTKRRMTAKAKADINESIEQIATYEKELEQLNDELSTEIAAITGAWDAAHEQLEVKEFKPRRADVQMELIAVAWRPSWHVRYREGAIERTLKLPADGND